MYHKLEPMNLRIETEEQYVIMFLALDIREKRFRRKEVNKAGWKVRGCVVRTSRIITIMRVISQLNRKSLERRSAWKGDHPPT